MLLIGKVELDCFLVAYIYILSIKTISWLFPGCVYFIYYKDCDNVGGSKIRLIIGK